MPRGKVRLVIEQIHLGRATRLKEIDHALHLGCKMRKALQSTNAIAVFGGHVARVEQRPQRHRTQPQRAAFQKGTAGLLRQDFVQRVHDQFCVIASSRLRMVFATRA